MLRDAMLDTARRVVSARRVVQYQNEIGVLAHLWYNALTTGLGTQTLGEEYCDLFQMDPRGAAPGAARRWALVFLDAFAERQWDDENYKGGRITFSKAEFTQRVNDHYAKGETNGLIDGYAPFCKHVFVPNFLDLPVQAVQITDKVAPFVESGYVSRTVKELPVLTRWIRESNLETVPTAKMLDVILYSREQIIAERVAQGMHIHSHSHAPARARST